MKIVYAFVGVLILGGGVWYVLTSDTQTTPGADQNQEVSQKADVRETPSGEPGQFRGSLQQLVARAGSWQCTIDVTTQGVPTKGTTYIADGKVRADFVSAVPGYTDIESHMIMRDNTVYTWSSLMAQGMKFPIQDGQLQGERKSTEVTPQFDQAYDYSCAAWQTDESKFALPSGITF
jgi:hypothetical protein